MSSERNKKTIRLFDDDPDRVESWKRGLEAIPAVAENYTVVKTDPKDFGRTLEALKERQICARTDSRPEAELDKFAILLDQTDIVIVDFDLTPSRSRLESGGDQISTLRGSFGDTFSYLTRCYTTAKYIVLVNQTFYQSTFDLTMREFEYSIADLNLSDSDLRNEHLWLGTTRPGSFRPWHWPKLCGAEVLVSNIASRMDLDARILETLGLAEDADQGRFDAQQLEVLGHANPTEATFADLIAADSKFGLRSESERPSEPQRKLIAASAIHRWLERVLIPAQNVLIDAPHLAQRRPHLLRDAADLDRLGELSSDAEIEMFLDTDLIRGAVTPASSYCSRSVWHWPSIPRENFRTSDLVFCEDTSRFLPIDSCSEFRSELPGPFQVRFVEELSQSDTGFPVEYRPDTRFHSV